MYRVRIRTSLPPQTSARPGERMRGLLKGLLGLAALFFRGSSSSSSSAAARFFAAFFFGLGSALALVPLDAGADLAGAALAGVGLEAAEDVLEGAAA